MDEDENIGLLGEPIISSRRSRTRRFEYLGQRGYDGIVDVRLICGDAFATLTTLTADSVYCCVTSPPYYGLRDYGVAGQLGIENTPDAYVRAMVKVFREVRRVLRNDGTLWLNMGDSYAGSWGNHYPTRERSTGAIRQEGLKPKDLIGIPWMLAFALRADGWWLRQDIVWSKPNVIPESITDRCTKSHEYIFMLTKSATYYYDIEAIKEPSIYAGDVKTTNGNMGMIGEYRTRDGLRRRVTVPEKRNKRSVWSIPPMPYPDIHFATFPPSLVQPCILAGCPVEGTVLDPFVGSGTTALVAAQLRCHSIGIDLNPRYVEMSRRRIEADTALLGLSRVTVEDHRG